MSIYVVNKATKCLNRLHRAMFGCTQEAKINAYKALVRPYPEYACAVWSPYTVHDTDLLETVQNRAARWIKSFWDPSTYQCSKFSATCVGEVGWPSLKVRRIYFPSGLFTVFCIKPLPLIFRVIFILILRLQGHIP